MSNLSVGSEAIHIPSNRPCPIKKVGRFCVSIEFNSGEILRCNHSDVRVTRTSFQQLSDAIMNAPLREKPALPEHVEQDVVEYLVENCREKDTQTAKAALKDYTTKQLFEMYCMWNGIIGYDAQLIEALDSIRAFKGER